MELEDTGSQALVNPSWSDIVSRISLSKPCNPVTEPAATYSFYTQTSKNPCVAKRNLIAFRLRSSICQRTSRRMRSKTLQTTGSTRSSFQILQTISSSRIRPLLLCSPPETTHFCKSRRKGEGALAERFKKLKNEKIKSWSKESAPVMTFQRICHIDTQDLD